MFTDFPHFQIAQVLEAYAEYYLLACCVHRPWGGSETSPSCTGRLSWGLVGGEQSPGSSGCSSGATQSREGCCVAGGFVVDC